MNKIALLGVVLWLAAAPCRAQDSESRRAGAENFFRNLFSFSPRARPPLQCRQVPGGPGARFRPAPWAGEIRLSGYVHLSGGGFVPRDAHSVNITVSGWATDLHDQAGRALSRSVHFSDTRFYSLSGGQVSDWVRPYAYAELYDSGKYLGTVRIEGNIHVSGFVSGGYVNLSGSGHVFGYLPTP